MKTLEEYLLDRAIQRCKPIIEQAEKIIPTLAKKYGIEESSLHIRLDGRIEWICSHGVGHTIHAPMEGSAWFIHGCCEEMCCNKLKEAKE